MTEQNHVTKLRLVEGYKFNVEFDDSTPGFLVDEVKPHGEGSGPNPPRILAAAIGHCLSSSLIYCLKKARVRVKDLETTVKMNFFRNEEGMRRVASIDVQLRLVVNEEDKSRVPRCLKLFENYCTVTQSVIKGIPVNINVI
ncbi:MAG: OsmC family protein [Candidatus Bathyarchaeum sp.]|nr:MAG: OsmC family protein [Candidatus Bathyarchaeum sp.]